MGKADFVLSDCRAPIQQVKRENIMSASADRGYGFAEAQNVHEGAFAFRQDHVGDAC
jgi:hypothetical protein